MDESDSREIPRWRTREPERAFLSLSSIVFYRTEGHLSCTPFRGLTSIMGPSALSRRIAPAQPSITPMEAWLEGIV